MRVSFRRVSQLLFLTVGLSMGLVLYWTSQHTDQRTRRAAARVQKFYVHTEKKRDDSFKKCPEVKKNRINIHLVPHSHFDVGWVKNVEQYYVGDSVPYNIWSTGCVRCTLTAVIADLLKNSSRRFLLAEMKYVARYWHEANEADRNILLNLIKEGRLEIVNGGWVMSDAAVTSYNDVIDQHTLGFDFIRDTFGAEAFPRTGWHLDQFGHSREHASIFSQMGFDSLFIGRIDYEDLARRKESKSLEFVWRTSPDNLKDRSTLFTHVLYDGYWAPQSFIFESNSLLSSGSVSEQDAKRFINILQTRIRSYRSNHVMVPMGGDFCYKDSSATNWFQNMDALIQKIHEIQEQKQTQQSNPGTSEPLLHLLYSSPDCYTYHRSQTREVLPVKSDDFLPYGIEPGVYWAGYFTTRGGFKMHIKYAGRILQSCKQLYILTQMDDQFEKVNKLRDTMAVMQHHDAITGTNRFVVLQDYNRLLSEAITECEDVMSKAYQLVWNPAPDITNLSVKSDWHFCHALNVSSCDVTEISKFSITLYNPLSWPVEVSVRFPIQAKNIEVIDNDGKALPVQIVPVIDAIKHIPERPSQAQVEAVFQSRVSPMSAALFKAKVQPGDRRSTPAPVSGTETVIHNEHLALTFDTSGKLRLMRNKESDIQEQVRQEFVYYQANTSHIKTSGAYLFVPEKGQYVVAPEKVETFVVKGDVVQEVHQTFNPWVSQVVRLHKGDKCAEFQWVVGPIPDDGKGRDVLSVFSTTLNSRSTFYTDSHGRETMTRIRNTPENNWYKLHDFVAGNFYPVTSRIFIQDEARRVQLTVLPDRPQGGSSLASGTLELMVHRRSFHDDDLGLAEALKDPGVDGRGIIFTGKHYVCLETVQNSVQLTRHLAQLIHMAPVPMFTPGHDIGSSNPNWEQRSFLTQALPDNVQVLTLDRISANESDLLLLRLEHVFERTVQESLSAPVILQLEDLFTSFKIVEALETTLGGNHLPSDVNRLRWRTQDGETQAGIESPNYTPNMEPPFEVELQPMEIRSFRVRIEKR